MTPEEKEFKAKLLSAFNSADPAAFEKAASTGSSEFIRRSLREDAFFPAILPFTTVTDSDLAQAVDTEEPFIICEMEAAQAMPKAISFHDSSETTPFYGEKFTVTFETNTTPKWYKNINYLRTYRHDIRQLLIDNSLRDLSRMKDVKGMRVVDEIVGPTPGAVSPVTGEQQNILLPGRLTRNNWISTKTYLTSRQLPNGCALMNHVTFNEFSRWTREEMGGDMAQKLFLEGNSAFESTEIGGTKIIATLKNDIIPNGVMYMFTAPNYLGRACVLQEPTMYVKKDKDMISVETREIIGATIANTMGLQKVTFQDVADPYGGDGRIIIKG